MSFRILLSIKILLTLISFCFLSSNLYSQFSLGIKAGFNNSWGGRRNFITTDEYVNRHGVELSLLAYVDIGKNLSMGVEPGNVQRVNTATTHPREGAAVENKMLLNYFELPLYISARFPLWVDRLKMNVKAGYGISSLNQAKIVFETGIPGAPPITETQNIGNKNIEHGIYSGIGIEYNIGQQRLFLESGMYMGMNYVFSYEHTKNRSIHLDLGYMIAF